MKELLWEAYYIYITPKNIGSKFGWGVVSTFWSACHTESQILKSQLWMGFVSIFWSASDTKSQKPKSQLLMGVFSVFWSASDTESKNPNSQHYVWWCHHLNTEHMQFLGGVSPRQRHLVLMRCYLLTIQVGNERIAVRSLLYIHNSKKN